MSWEDFEKFVEDFEDAEEKYPLSDHPMDEFENVFYYMFAKMFKKDLIFRNYMQACIGAFIKAHVRNDIERLLAEHLSLLERMRSKW